jgi:hypothetical protein
MVSTALRGRAYGLHTPARGCSTNGLGFVFVFRLGLGLRLGLGSGLGFVFRLGLVLGLRLGLGSGLGFVFRLGLGLEPYHRICPRDCNHSAKVDVSQLHCRIALA